MWVGSNVNATNVYCTQNIAGNNLYSTTNVWVGSNVNATNVYCTQNIAGNNLYSTTNVWAGSNVNATNVYASQNIYASNIASGGFSSNSINTTVSSTLNITGGLLVSGAAGGLNQTIITTGVGAGVQWGTIVGSQWTTVGSDIYYTTGRVGIGTNAPTANLHVFGNIVATNAVSSSNLSLSGNANILGLSNIAGADIFRSNIVTANVTTINVTNPLPITTGLFMNLHSSYTLNSTGNWYGNIAGSWTSNLYTLFGPDPIAYWDVYGANPLVSGPSINGSFKFNQSGPWVFTVVITSDNNIKTIALSSNTSDVHSNLADTDVWEYVYRIGVGQDPSTPVAIPFYVDNPNKYYFIDIETFNQTDNIHRTRYTNTAAEAYTGSYAMLRPL